MLARRPTRASPLPLSPGAAIIVKLFAATRLPNGYRRSGRATQASPLRGWEPFTRGSACCCPRRATQASPLHGRDPFCGYRRVSLSASGDAGVAPTSRPVSRHGPWRRHRAAPGVAQRLEHIMSEAESLYEQERRQKLQKLRDLGVDPFGGATPGVVPLATIKAAHKPEMGQDGGPVVKAAGRVVLKRDMGKLSFLTLRDETGDLRSRSTRSRLERAGVGGPRPDRPGRPDRRRRAAGRDQEGRDHDLGDARGDGGQEPAAAAGQVGGA